MYRNIINNLAKWYEEDSNKVLMLKGARGVGKTWVIEDFASAFFDATVVIDLSQVKKSQDVLQDKDSIQLYVEEKVDKNKKNVLVVFDEVQLKSDIKSILEYAMNVMGKYRVCLVASYVGELVGESNYIDSISSFTLAPMTFEEFLIANKAQKLLKCIEGQRVEPISEKDTQQIMNYLKTFFVIGGMPKVVLDYVKYKDVERTEKIHQEILLDYKKYIEKYAPDTMCKKVLQIWNSIPKQLAKDNKKFMYGYVDEKARAREYEASAKWLVNHGLVRKIYRVKEGKTPLANEIDNKSFELFHLDQGLLRQMAGLKAKRLIERTDIFSVISGSLISQMVYAELYNNSNISGLYYWVSGATAKVDFVFEDDGDVIPVVVQDRLKPKAQNVKVFKEKYNNRMAIRISLDGLNFEKGVLNIPLYGLWNF